MKSGLLMQMGRSWPRTATAGQQRYKDSLWDPTVPGHGWKKRGKWNLTDRVQKALLVFYSSVERIPKVGIKILDGHMQREAQTCPSHRPQDKLWSPASSTLSVGGITGLPRPEIANFSSLTLNKRGLCYLVVSAWVLASSSHTCVGTWGCCTDV